VRLVADLSSAIGDEVALPQMAQAELEKSNVFMSGTATDARSRRVVPLKFHCSRYDLLRVSRPRALKARSVGEGRQARLDEAGRAAGRRGGAPEHVAKIMVERGCRESTISVTSLAPRQ
jgi:hypothetical protein